MKLNNGTHGAELIASRLGGWLLDCIMQAAAGSQRYATRGTQTVHYVVPTPEFLEIKDAVMRMLNYSLH